MNIDQLLSEIEECHRVPFKAAYDAALTSYGVGGNGGSRFRLGAVITSSKGRVLVARPNFYKTHTKLAGFYEWPFLHAEANSILAKGMDNCGGLNLYVIRIRKDNSIAMAKPCAGCQALINHVNINSVFYTDETLYGTLNVV